MTISHKIITAFHFQLQHMWFLASSQKLSNPHEVEDLLSEFNEISALLLAEVVNMEDCNVSYGVSESVFYKMLL